ncbi:MAG: peptidyl-tRNA hydrolase [Gammaproteobacteria bacterium]|nr:MAG: peptidyl-tRNA hydrolase [Gammaproteobacteria bacterium]
MTGEPLKLIVGLGNPGIEYARTRHNAGFQVVDELARRHQATFRSEPRHQAELARAHIYDELDFPAGVVRLKQGGGAAGHNGMRDVIAHMGDAFWRLRIGIGHPGDRSAVLDYVLGRPNAADAELIREALLVAADAVPVLLTEGAQSAMNRLHSRGPSPGEPPATNS